MGKLQSSGKSLGTFLKNIIFSCGEIGEGHITFWFDCAGLKVMRLGKGSMLSLALKNIK